MVEQIRIDSAPLHCSICLNIFSGPPEVLPCGHSHCVNCLDGIENVAIREAANNRTRIDQVSIECPLCRARCSLTRRRVKNFSIEAIIQSMGTTTKAKDATNETIAAKDLAIKRLEQNVRQMKKQRKDDQQRVDRSFMLGCFTTYFFLGFISWLLSLPLYPPHTL